MKKHSDLEQTYLKTSLDNMLYEAKAEPYILVEESRDKIIKLFEDFYGEKIDEELDTQKSTNPHMKKLTEEENSAIVQEIVKIFKANGI